MPGLYIHIPFCKQACHYCDFHFSTNLSRQNEMVSAICKEMAIQKDYLDNTHLDSIYFGGGTPSLLNSIQLERLLETIYKWFTPDQHCEITLEANPDDLDKNTLSTFKKMGINRLSIGIQSFDDAVLKFINRAHDSKMAHNALDAAREMGFNNISLDLMYAIPGQYDAIFENNITTALKFNPEHISAYALTIEKQTVFGNWYVKNKLTPVDDTVSASQFELLMAMLTANGYEHYEISNFSKSGIFSRHNSSYWKQEPYLGVGPGAHSYNKQSRQFNIQNNSAYLKSIDEGIVPFEREVLSLENKINEYVFTTLRTKWGCNTEKLLMEHGYNLLHEKQKHIGKLIENNLIYLDNNILTLTSRGKLLADQISLDLMV